MTPPPPANNLPSAIQCVNYYALIQFNAAFDTLMNPTPPDPTKTAEENKKALAAEQAKARGEMTSALQQLVQAEVMLSDHTSREGLGAIVTLMKETQQAADDAFGKLKTLTTLPSANPQLGFIDSLSGLLKSLAMISPLPVWQKVPPSSAP